MIDRMACTYCGRSYSWPDGFPHSSYAKCWRCYLYDRIQSRRDWKRLRREIAVEQEMRLR